MVNVCCTFCCVPMYTSVRQIHRPVGPAGQICDWSDLPHFQPDRNVRCCFQYYVYSESESDRYMFGPMKCFSKQDRITYEVPQSFADTGIHGISSRMTKLSAFCFVHVLYCVTYWNISLLDK